VNALPPDYRERRGERVLLVWGDLPYWAIVDADADRFVQRLSDEGLERPATRDEAEIIAALRRAGAAGTRRLRPPKERIESISVNVTNRCNLRCRFCYNGTPANAGGEMRAEEMIAALESVRRWTARGAALALLGGEPLLEAGKTLALAVWGSRRGLRPIVSTNGLLVDDPFAQAAAKARLDVQVSIDGATPDNHEAVRGPGTFDRAIHAVETLVSAGAHTVMSLVFHAGNVGEIPDYLRLARRLRADEARFIPIKQIGGGREYRAADLVYVARMVRETMLAEPELRLLLGRDYFSVLAQTCQSCALRQGCGTGSQTFLLDADGTIYPCINLRHPEFAAGNVRDQSLSDIWRQSGVLLQVRQRAATNARLGTCAKCCMRYWCMGGCRGETYARTGQLDAPAVTCVQNRASIMEMMWTIGEHPELLRSGPKLC
jgi:radical SAM protein with 4Fe4S-binding SPASM domain